MDTITDYILWRGDLDFQTQPFNILDAMVLSQITYFDMNSFFRAHESGSITDIYRHLRAVNSIECTLVGPDEKSILIFEAAAASKRFGDIFIHHHADLHDVKYSMQFAAMCFDIGCDTSYVSYRGTDDSVAGWQEDCMMSFRKTKSQEYALEYLINVISDSNAAHIIAGGHSKGANHAMFASALLPSDLQTKLEHVYIFDGPGFSPDVFDIAALQRIRYKMTMVIPEYCIVGKIFPISIPDSHIIKSTDLGLMQHNMSTWRVDHLQPCYTHSNAVTSDLIVKHLMHWVNDMNLEKREEVVSTLFKHLKEGVTNLEQLLNKIQ